MAQKKKKSNLPSSKSEKKQNKIEKINDAKGDFSADEQTIIAENTVNVSPIKKNTKGNDEDLPEIDNTTVSRTTLYFSIIFALFFGVYMGTLLPSFFGEPHVISQVEEQVEMPPEITKRTLELEQIVLKNPKDTASWINLGNLYFDTHKHEESIHAYEEALKLNPDNAGVLTDLGVMYRSISNYEKALECFDKANKVDPQHENSLFNSGIVLYFDLDRKEEGRSKWRELLKINPNAKAPDGKSVGELIKGNF